MIGVYDSGLGGVLELNKILKDNPKSDVVYLGDQKNAPYGNKDSAELLKIFNYNLQRFKNLGVKELILACNTLCSTIDFSRDYGLKIYDLIANTCARVDLKYENILVFATRQTIKKGRYHKILEERGFHTQDVSLDELAGMLEEFQDTAVIKDYLYQIFRNITFKPDALVLGCTHYPIVSELFKEYFACPIYDSQDIDFNLALDDEECGKIYVLMSDDERNRLFFKRYVHHPCEFVTYEELIDRFGLTP